MLWARAAPSRLLAAKSTEFENRIMSVEIEYNDTSKRKGRGL
jgi:hypothetical protein